MTLSSSLEISVAGLTAQADRIKVHANNIANIGTPYYQRKIPILAENPRMTFEDVIAGMRKGVINAAVSYGPGGTMMTGVAVDPLPGKRIYQPGHPQADKDGYITLSNVNPLTDMADATSASRLYEANLGVISIVKNMANKALEIGRGN